ncbi:MAG: ribonuclease R [Eubacteriales bacterium]|nr:ribonuclease R [Eubacteriales bacterium]
MYEDYEKRKELVYQLICDPLYKPMKEKEIAILMQVPREDRMWLSEILMDLQIEGKIERTKRGKYQKPELLVLTGVLQCTAKGFGFVTVEDREEDIFVPEEEKHGAIHLDTVEVTVRPGGPGRRAEGSVRRVLAHEITRVVGTYHQSKKFGFVEPDNQRLTEDLYIPAECSAGAENGQKVVAEYTGYGDDRKKPQGKITQIIGRMRDPGTDILSVIYGYDLPQEFPERVLQQAERVSKPVSEADRAGRLDLRKLQTVTIDGEDAKDLDDAISLTIDEATGNYHLGVHIADVTNYVQENSALDREALTRGTSVYLTDRVIPMLPRQLSNGICSLNQGEDRLALSCLMEIDPKGTVVAHQIAETVICVDRRMTYTSVAKILEEKDEQERSLYQEFVPLFERMEILSGVLREKRSRRGAIDFDFPEAKILLDEHGKACEIVPHERNTATKIIEDFMLLANETVAEDYYWQELPFVYRTHENPDPEKIRQLAAFIANFGYGMKGIRDEVHPKELQKLLSRIAGSPEEALISRLTLRSMKRAKYSTECSGHFGLSAKYYCHFTSPIRRYPDLQIHRIIKENLRGRLNEERISHYEGILPEVAEESSRLERRAEEAERETDKMKKAEYMRRHIGEEFDGVICGMNAYGFYVELENTVEGMVHVSTLWDDHYEYDEREYVMQGLSTGRKFQLGERVRIRVLDADTKRRTIDFELAEGGNYGITDGEADCE